MHKVLANRLGGLNLPRKSVVRLTDCPDMTLDVYPGHKTTVQQQPILGLVLQGMFPVRVVPHLKGRQNEIAEFLPIK